MRAGASIAKEIVRRIDELFAIERDISGKPPTNGEPRTRNFLVERDGFEPAISLAVLPNTQSELPFG